MPFRANESAIDGYEDAKQYLISRHVEDKAGALRCLDDLVERFGPVVDHYPSWHPLVAHHDSSQPETSPSERCGYRGLDHNVFFRNAFVTCPYDDDQAVLDSVRELQAEYNDISLIHAERLDVKLYHEQATAILVWCDWSRPMAEDGTIPKSLAVPLMLEYELPMWRWAEVAEPWESMRSYLLGGPGGSRSSLFVNQDTGMAMKRMWNQLMSSGAFGPEKKRPA
ncbi:MAG: hypothetical protein ACIAS6_01225 [Phycisphaerales bacterium JB060]